MTRRWAAFAAGAFVVVAAACGDDRYDGVVPEPAPEGWEETLAATSTAAAPTPAPTVAAPGDIGADGIIEVPAEVDSIQGAVDAAAAGDLVLVSPGTYNEAVTVETPNLTIRGLERDGVVLDGQFSLENGIHVFADGVAVENMTAQNYAVNGFYWYGVEGFRGSYLNAIRNGDYGVYAFGSTKGLFEHSYGAGSPDAGVYIGQCYPCDTVIDDFLAEHNGLGYSGTNAGGNLFIVNSTFRNNRAGIVPNSGSYELCYPERETTIVGNLVYDNNQADTAAIEVALTVMGNGILVAGGIGNRIERNLVFDHDLTGIGLVPYPEDSPNDDLPTRDEWERTCEESLDDPLATVVPDNLFWESYDNRIVDNVVSDSRLADLAVGAVSVDPATMGNCFAGNAFASSAPPALETLAPCDGATPGPAPGSFTGALDLAALVAPERPGALPYDEAPLPDPPELPDMPDAATAPARPAVDVPPAVDVDAITVPAPP